MVMHGIRLWPEASKQSFNQSTVDHPPGNRFVDDVESGNDVSIDGRGRRNASDAKMLARDDARDHRRSANLARGR